MLNRLVMKQKVLNNYGALELARNLAMVYGLSYSYEQLCYFCDELYPKFTLRDLAYLRVHVTMVMRCLADDLHDISLDYATKEMSGTKFFRLQSDLLRQFNELSQLI